MFRRIVKLTAALVIVGFMTGIFFILREEARLAARDAANPFRPFGTGPTVADPGIYLGERPAELPVPAGKTSKEAIAMEVGAWGSLAAGLIAGGRLAVGALFGSRPGPEAPKDSNSYLLSRPLLQWSGGDVWSVGDAVEGTLILGATGSGKTFGSGRAIAHAFLRNGFGALVLTAKADERSLWEDYCRETGREKDLIIFGCDQPWRFNYLNHEAARKGAGAGQTENIVNLFSIVLEIAERTSGQGGNHSDEAYWRRANRQLCRNAVDLLMLATGKVSIPELYRLVVSAPTSMEQLRSEDWKKSSFCFACLAEADTRPKTPQQRRDFEIVTDYFCCEFASLSDKTRSVIVSTFTSMVDVLNRGTLRELFCTESNLTPEVIEDGKIVLVDLPVKQFAEVGLFAQVLWKYCFQRSVERRDVRANPRPVFLWVDECHHFLTSYDQQFQTTCRSSLVATVLLSQNLSNFYAALGGNEKARVETDSLCGNLATKLFHCNSDAVTNEWAARMIGRVRQHFVNANTTNQPVGWFDLMGGFGQPTQTSAGVSESMDYEVEPSTFSTLRTGGAHHKGFMDAIVFRNGRRFQSTGRTWMPVTFDSAGTKR